MTSKLIAGFLAVGALLAGTALTIPAIMQTAETEAQIPTEEALRAQLDQRLAEFDERFGANDVAGVMRFTPQAH